MEILVSLQQSNMTDTSSIQFPQHSRNFSQELFDGILMVRDKTMSEGKTRKKGGAFLRSLPLC